MQQFFEMWKTYVLNWLLNIENAELTFSDIEDRCKVISIWTQYMSEAEMNWLLKGLSEWQCNFNGKALSKVLSCKLRLETEPVTSLKSGADKSEIVNPLPLNVPVKFPR